MDSILSLGAPLKQFTSSCVSGKKSSSERGTDKTSQSGRRSSFTRRKSISRRRSLPCSSQKVPDSWLRVYQAELKRERRRPPTGRARLNKDEDFAHVNEPLCPCAYRKRQQAILAKKNAERSVRKTHFRSHHCLRRTPAARKPVAAAAAKDDSFFGAFQGLSLDGLMGGTNAAPVAPPSVGGDQCKVM